MVPVDFARGNPERSRRMRKGGLEPPWPSGHRILSPARLPVPPLSHESGGFSLARSRVRAAGAAIVQELGRMLPSVAPCSFRNRSPTARIFIMACFAGMPTSMVNPAYRGIPSARRRFPARPPGACCEWPHSMRVQPPSARRARSTATVDSYRLKVICGWRMRAPDVSSSSGSQACDSVGACPSN